MPIDTDYEYHNPQTQEPKVNETVQELPAVAKLREAFDTARNALIDGSELAKQVGEMSITVQTLKGEVSSLQRDLEYVRNRNRELDEQVTQVRRARDEAMADASEQRVKADGLQKQLETEQIANEGLRVSLSGMYDRIDALKKERDDAQMAQMEMEDKLKAAEAKLAKIAEMFGSGETSVNQDKPKPHYETQPRDEVGKFQPIEEPKNYGSGSQGSF
jgi:chromosome segregation ATPase